MIFKDDFKISGRTATTLSRGCPRLVEGTFLLGSIFYSRMIPGKKRLVLPSGLHK